VRVALLAAIAVIPSGCGGDGAPAPCNCRGDETCVVDVCTPWAEAPLSVDFDLVVDGLSVTCTVAPGGFPRDRVDSLRFWFGDGVAGYGERIGHTYAAAGVYPVDLEVRLEGYRVLRASRLAAVAPAGEGVPPARLTLTVDAIPDQLNGTIPAVSDAGTPTDTSDDVAEPFHLLLPGDGFTVDVDLLDGPGAEIDAGSLHLVADRDLGGGAVPAGSELAGFLAITAGGADRVRRARWQVAPAQAFPTGMVTLTLTGDDGGGGHHQHAIGFEVTALDAAHDPFDRPMSWLFLFDEDRFTIGPRGDGGIAIGAGADGAIDFDQELEVIGGRGSESAPGAAEVSAGGRRGANAIFRRWVIDAVVAEVRRYYHIAPDGTPRDGIDFAIAVAGDPGAPAPADFATGDFSMMRFGGTLGSNLGRSSFSAWNQGRVDDTSADLGVATGTILSTVATTAGTIDEVYPIVPGLGTPVGEHPADAVVLAGDFDRWDPGNDGDANLRHDDLRRIARRLGEAIAAVAAHEMGHAMGLVPDDAPPLGFFGGRADITFMGAERTDSHHADYPGLNLMQAGSNLVGALADALDLIEVPEGSNLLDLILIFSQENRLSPYSLAYFQRRLTYSAF